jgi:hypothetical protein
MSIGDGRDVREMEKLFKNVIRRSQQTLKFQA